MNILFDLDGTLTDPEAGITRSICYALDQLNRPHPNPQTLRSFIGPPLLPSLRSLVDTDDQAQACLDHYRDRFATTGIYENSVYEGIPEVLQTLRDQGHTLYLATSKPTIYAIEILKHFNLAHHFNGVYGSALDGTHSNKADLIRLILKTESLNPETTIMIGDREHDIKGANANGIKSIAVLYGYGSKEELEAANPTTLCPTPIDLSHSGPLSSGGEG